MLVRRLILCILFTFRFPPSRWWALTTLVLIPLGRVVGRRAANFGLGFCVVRDSTVRAKRTLVWLDLLLTLTIGAVVGFSSAVNRFLIGCMHLFGKLVLFQAAIVPDRLAFMDGGFGAYGAAMMGRHGHCLQEEQEAAARRRPMLQPGSLANFG